MKYKKENSLNKYNTHYDQLDSTRPVSFCN